MRLWTVHPKYLDAKGLIALWREALLAKKVLLGKTRGYKHHPQLLRFRDHIDPQSAITVYLKIILAEAKSRGYRFDGRRIHYNRTMIKINETKGQLLYEWTHLKRKLKKRDYKEYLRLKCIKTPQCHPLFRIVYGEARDWEKIKI